jgi:hypothetical protein
MDNAVAAVAIQCPPPKQKSSRDSYSLSEKRERNIHKTTTKKKIAKCLLKEALGYVKSHIIGSLKLQGGLAGEAGPETPH